MKNLALIISFLFIFSCCSQSPNGLFSEDNINLNIQKGNFSEAEKIIKIKLATEADLSAKEKYDLEFKIDVMNRIRKDFSKTDSTVLAYIKDKYPNVTEQEIASWEKSNALECMVIDGQKRYFNSAARNLFRIDKQAQKQWDAIKGRQSDDLDKFLECYIPKFVESAAKDKVENLLLPITMKIKYSLSVKPNEVPEGQTIRVWMPYPRESKRNYNIKLLSTTNKDYIISSDSYAHKSIYMEAKSVKDSTIRFGYELEFTSANHYFNINADLVQPYDTLDDLYKKYTAQAATHVIFTDTIKHLTDSLIQGESNPYNKVVKIFDYIATTYPWASAREYSTISNIPQYVIENKHGDCGQVSLLFITMARYAGIPAKWQSGWMLHPGEVNLHDWAEVYFNPIGWVPIDQSFGLVKSNDEKVHHYYIGGIDAFRYNVNEDFSQDFFPAKIHPRSETVDFQRGEVEWCGENLYFGRWTYKMDVEQIK